MKYRDRLNWMKSLGEFAEQEKRVLMALSREEFRWRTKERIASATGLAESDVERVLSDLISKGLVILSLSQKKNIIYGLKELVG